MHSIELFKQLAAEKRFRGWPLVGEPELGDKIPWFGQALNYKLKTGNGVEDYTSVLRSAGWAVCCGIFDNDGVPTVITLCQWKPGINKAGWDLPPGGIGKITPGTSVEEITKATRLSYLAETGFGNGNFQHIGHVAIDSGKYRGASADDHGMYAHVLMATGLERVQDARQPNPNEIMQTIMVPISEFPAVMKSGLFLETSAVNCIYEAFVDLGYLRWEI